MIEIRCDDCSQNVPDGAVFCGYCGTRVGPRRRSPPLLRDGAVKPTVYLLTHVKRRRAAGAASPAAPRADRERPARPAITPFLRPVEIDEQSLDNFYCGFERRIRGNGVFVATPNPAPLGALVLVSLGLPGAPTRRSAVGRVKWIREHAPERIDGVAGMGLALGALPQELERVIDAFMKRHDPIFYVEA